MRMACCKEAAAATFLSNSRSGVDVGAGPAGAGLAAAVVVAAEATVIDSVLLPHATVGRGASVDRSLVMGSVGADSRITDCMVGADGAVPDGAELVGVAIPESS